MTLFIILTLALTAGVAWANGANDVSKGVATLVGSRLASYHRGLNWGTAWTLAGAVAAMTLTTALLHTFSTSLVSDGVASAAQFPVSVAAGAFTWVLLATRTGLPVSTTHSLAGAIVGAALAAGGLAGVNWPAVVTAVALPLALSPFFSAGLSYLVHAVMSRRLSAAAHYCVCFAERPLIAMPQVIRLSSAAAAARPLSVPIVLADQEQACASRDVTRAVRATDAAHWVTSAALSFARGLNDTPKIAALGLTAAAAAGAGAAVPFVICAAAMGAGSLFAGRRVTRTLAERVTEVDPLEGLAASGVAAMLVLAASVWALPVSTTHVASGAIVGVGLRASGAGGVYWGTVSNMAAAWLITLPVSAIVSAAAWLAAS